MLLPWQLIPRAETRGEARREVMRAVVVECMVMVIEGSC